MRRMFDKEKNPTSERLLRYFQKRNIGRTVLSGLLVLSLVSGSVMLQPITSYATADTGNGETQTDAGTDDTNQTDANGEEITDASVEKAREDKEEAHKNKKEAQEILKKLKQAKSDIQDYIIELDKSINEFQVEIVHLEKTQKELQESIAVTKQNLEIAKAAQEDQYEAMKQRIQMVYESGNKRYLDVLLTATSMTDIINKTEYISQVSLYDYNILKQLKVAKEQVANLKLKLDKDLESNEALQAQVNEQKEEMEAIVDAKSVQLASYEISIETQQEEVDRFAKAEAEAEAIIFAAEQAASSSATSVYTGGVFTWPVPGYNEISSYFGNRTSPTEGASSNHKGIDIKCDTGATVVAAASGTVIVATYNAAEGNYVCIDHGGGVVSLYMHNSSLAVSVGETVVAGQTIAYAGSTGISTGPHCHFGVRVDGNYVDPLSYLQ